MDTIPSTWLELKLFSVHNDHDAECFNQIYIQFSKTLLNLSITTALLLPSKFSNQRCSVSFVYV